MKWGRYNARRRGEKEAEMTETHKVVSVCNKAASRGPLRGSGTYAGDLHRPDDGKQADAYNPDDPRKGAVFCRKCGISVKHVEVDGKWQTRDLDNTPHELTCEPL